MGALHVIIPFVHVVEGGGKRRTQKEPVKNVMRPKKDATPPKITIADNFN